MIFAYNFYLFYPAPALVRVSFPLSLSLSSSTKRENPSKHTNPLLLPQLTQERLHPRKHLPHDETEAVHVSLLVVLLMVRNLFHESNETKHEWTLLVSTPNFSPSHAKTSRYTRMHNLCSHTDRSCFLSPGIGRHFWSSRDV